ncbi:hypothetical protein DIPPA_01028 [Diplonema papillatum]|nr:hypothetical protein DIPPA_01028 [Diplonema papillatum]
MATTLRLRLVVVGHRLKTIQDFAEEGEWLGHALWEDIEDMVGEDPDSVEGRGKVVSVHVTAPPGIEEKEHEVQFELTIRSSSKTLERRLVDALYQKGETDTALLMRPLPRLTSLMKTKQRHPPYTQATLDTARCLVRNEALTQRFLRDQHTKKNQTHRPASSPTPLSYDTSTNDTAQFGLSRLPESSPPPVPVEVSPIPFAAGGRRPSNVDFDPDFHFSQRGGPPADGGAARPFAASGSRERPARALMGPEVPREPVAPRQQLPRPPPPAAAQAHEYAFRPAQPLRVALPPEYHQIHPCEHPLPLQYPEHPDHQYPPTTTAAGRDPGDVAGIHSSPPTQRCALPHGPAAAAFPLGESRLLQAGDFTGLAPLEALGADPQQGAAAAAAASSVTFQAYSLLPYDALLKKAVSQAGHLAELKRMHDVQTLLLANRGAGGSPVDLTSVVKERIALERMCEQLAKEKDACLAELAEVRRQAAETSAGSNKGRRAVPGGGCSKRSTAGGTALREAAWVHPNTAPMQQQQQEGRKTAESRSSTVDVLIFDKVAQLESMRQVQGQPHHQRQCRRDPTTAAAAAARAPLLQAPMRGQHNPEVGLSTPGKTKHARGGAPSTPKTGGKKPFCAVTKPSLFR